jgi:tRNA pseudouridine13 synthase
MVLSQRVEQGSWNQAIAGDVMMLAGSHSVFTPETLDDEIMSRVQQQDIHPTGPLWGRGRLATSGDALAIEQAVANGHALWCDGLERAGMKQERRALRLPVETLEWNIADDSCELSFFLSAGSYATSVLRELLHTAGS